VVARRCITERSLPELRAAEIDAERARPSSCARATGPKSSRSGRATVAGCPTSAFPAVLKDAMSSGRGPALPAITGVDPIGIARSVWVRVQSGRWRQGGSTITQQLARNIFLNNSRTLRPQDPRGAACAGASSRSSPRTRCSSSDLNKVYFGGGAYGVRFRRAQVLRPFGRAAEPAPRRRSSPGWSRRPPTIRRPADAECG